MVTFYSHGQEDLFIVKMSILLHIINSIQFQPNFHTDFVQTNLKNFCIETKVQE